MKFLSKEVIFLIELKELTKKYEGSNAPALSDINLNIERGELVFLVGLSGVGKTTLIKLIFREISPTSGSVYFRGRNIFRFKPRELLAYRRNIGMVFQDFRLIKSKTIYENVAFALEVIGESRREIEKKVPAALDMVDLSHKLDVFPNQLSGGEQQRVGIARAIVKNPQLILADEPTGNVDPRTAREIMNLFDKINQGGTTVIIATHAWELVNEMKKRVISLEDGCLKKDNKQEEGYCVT